MQSRTVCGCPGAGGQQLVRRGGGADSRVTAADAVCGDGSPASGGARPRRPCAPISTAIGSEK
ncbi:hypothetical protein EA472_01545 [Natrarchaeobius oligotrophus]|uniref:Uncharacterized protein n=1 Tax=Natrarchaeobius chitinivorans TaxID=1679083 RepID=A0A3N6NSQ2_NATCH|nr:hypothetical protein EA472_01545 [Natrarchaeobius chitinivorans]